MNDTPKTDIRALADLARIEVEEDELRSLEKEIPDILAFVEEINAFSVDEASGESGLRNVVRDDANSHEPAAYTEALLEAAPEHRDGYVRVKQVVRRDAKDLE